MTMNMWKKDTIWAKVKEDFPEEEMRAGSGG